VALLWVIRLAELIPGVSLSSYGVYPRRQDALAGILLAPLIHGSFAHLSSNTPPLLVLVTALLYGYPRCARIVLPVVYLGSGLAVWLLARPGYHVGASGLAFGLLFFILTMGVLRWERRAIALSLIVFVLYGGMVWGVLPSEPQVSFEYHLYGAALGVLLAFALRRYDPPVPGRRYSWEEEAEGGSGM
jgi:membrane associated rhomboid family serine protease